LHFSRPPFGNQHQFSIGTTAAAISPQRQQADHMRLIAAATQRFFPFCVASHLFFALAVEAFLFDY
jgi:hypothetical protein